MTQNNQRIPFQERDPEAAEKVNKGVKLKNKNTTHQNPKIQQQENFEQQVQEYQKTQIDRNSQAKQLAQQFVNLLKEKKLTQNKTQINLDLEREVQTKLVNLLIEINNDPNEENDGMGSAATIMLILKSLFIQRDKINELEYKLEQALKDIAALNKSTVKKNSSSKPDNE